MSNTLERLNGLMEAREKLDNAVYEYIEATGTDADMVDYSVLDVWLENLTGVVNPLEENE